MYNYQLENGNIVDESQLSNFAEQNGLSLKELLGKNPDIKKIEEDKKEEEPKSFQTGPTKETAVVGPQEQSSMELNSEAISSELPDPDPVRYIVYNNETIYEYDYKKFAGKDGYPKTFDEYAKATNAEILTADPVELSVEAKPTKGKGRKLAERNTRILVDQLGKSVFAGGNNQERFLANEKLQELTGEAGEYALERVSQPDVDENTWNKSVAVGGVKIESARPGSFVFNYSGEIPEDIDLSFIDMPTARQARVQSLSKREQQNAIQVKGIRYPSILNKEVLYQGFQFLSPEERTIYELSERYNETKDESLLKQLEIYNEKYGQMLYDPTTGKLVNYDKASPEALIIDSQAQQKADESDVETLQGELTDNYYALIGLAKDIIEYQEETGVDIFSDNMTAAQKISDGFSMLFGSDKSLYKDKQYLQQIYRDGDLPKNINFLPGNHPYITEFNNQLENYFVLNRALQINRDPATIQEENVGGEFVDGMVSLLNAEAVVDPNSTSVKTTASNFVKAIEGAGYEPNQQIEKNLEKTIVESAARGLPDLAGFVGEIAVTRRLSAPTIGKGFKYLDKAISGIKNPWYRRGAQVAVGGVKEATDFVTSETIFSNITKPSEEVDYFDTSKFGFSLGVGNVVSGKILNKIPWPTFSPITRAMANSRGARSLSKVVSGAATGSAVFQFAQLTTDYEEYLDKSFEDITEEFVVEFVKMTALGSKSLFGKNGMIREFRDDILNMKSESVETNAIAKEWNINKNDLKENPDNARQIVEQEADRQIKEVEDGLRDESLSNEEAQQKLVEIESKKAKLDFQINLAEAQAQIKVERGQAENATDLKGNKLTPTNEEIYTVTQKLAKGERLTARENYVLANTDYALLVKMVGAQPNQQLVDNIIESSMQAEAIENILDTYKTQYGEADRTVLYDYLTDAYSLQNKLKALKARPNKTESDKEEIKQVEDQLKQYDLDGTQYNLVIEKLQAVTEQKYAEDVEQARAIVAETLEGELVEAQTPEEFQSKYEEAFPESRVDKTGSNGFYDPNTKTFYINTQRVKDIRNVTTATHEVGHFILRDSLKDENNKVTQEGIQLIDQVLEKLTPQQRAVVDARINENYKFDRLGNERAKEDYYEEYLTSLSEAIRSKQIVFNENIGNSLLNFVPFLRKNGLENLEINTTTAEGLFNLIKSYSTGDIAGAIKVSKAAEQAKRTSRAEAMESIEMTKLLNDLTAGKITEEQYEQKLDDLLSKVETREAKAVKKPTNNEELFEVIQTAKPGSKEYNDAYTNLQKSYVNLGLKAIKFDPTKSDLISREEAIDFINGYFATIVKNYNPAKGKFSTHVFSNLSPKKSLLYTDLEQRAATGSIDVQRGDIGYIAEVGAITSEDAGFASAPVEKIKIKIQPKRFLNRESQTELEKSTKNLIESEDFDFKSLTFAESPNLGAKEIAKELDIREAQITDPTKNLNYSTRYNLSNGKTNVLKSAADKIMAKDPSIKIVQIIEPETFRARRFLKKAFNDGLLKVLPDYNVAPELGKFGPEGYENLQGTSLKIARNVLRSFYEEAKDSDNIKEELDVNSIKTFERWYAGKRSAGLRSQAKIVRKKDLSQDQINEILDLKRPEGITDKEWMKMQDNNAQLLKGLLSITGKLATNSEIRKQLEIASDEVSALSAGKAGAMFSEGAERRFVQGTINELARLAYYTKDGKLRKKPSIKNFNKVIQKSLETYDKALNAYAEEGSVGFKNVIEQIRKEQGDDLADFYDQYFENRNWELGVFADASTRNKGYKYEDFLEKMLKAQKIEGVEVVRSSKSNIGPGDITLKVGDKVWNVEIKANENAQFGGYSNSSKSKAFQKIKNNVYVQKMSEVLTSDNFNKAQTSFYNEALKFAEENGYTAFMNNGKKETYSLEDRLYAEPEVWDYLVNSGLQKQLTREIETDASVIIDLYNSKGVHHIDIGKKGVFSLGDDALNLGIEPLENQIKEGDAKLVSRMIQSSTNQETGLKTASIRTQSELIAPSLNESNFRLTNRNDILRVSEKIKQDNKVEAMESVENIDRKVNENLFELNEKFSPKTKVTKSEAINDGNKVDSDNKWKYLAGKIAPESNDFLGLLYDTLLPGEKGNEQKKFYKKIFTDPFNRAYNLLDKDQLVLSSNYKQAKKAFGISNNRLEEKVGDTYFRNEDAVRVFIWKSQGYSIPDITKKQELMLLDHVKQNKDLRFFANSMRAANSGFGFAKPQENWIAGGLKGDMANTLKKINRPERLREWQSNVDTFFSEDNLNKMQAVLGTRWRVSMENSLMRQKTGENRLYKVDSQVGKFVDQLSGAVLNTLNWNNKSALLQLTSAGNFINWTDNNPIAASRAFANQKQYWQDFSKLFFSDFLKQRRSGLQLDLNEQDVADLARAKGFGGFVAKMLKLGMTPTVIADNIAIAGGGATFYRNRIKTYLREGLSQTAAERKAYQDFRENAESTQQSSRPDKISMQQAGPLGRIVLAYTNTPQQYMREMQKSLRDVKNRRGNYKTNVSKIMYYGFLQNLLFTGLQQGVSGLLFDDEEVVIPSVMSDEEFVTYLDSLDPKDRSAAIKKRKVELKEKTVAEAENKKKVSGLANTINGMMDTGLKGLGLYGSVLATLKNAGFRSYLESLKQRPDYAEQIPKDLLAISPPLSIKYGQIRRGIGTLQYNWDEIRERGLGDLSNPIYQAGADITAGFTNVPLNRFITKAKNISHAMNRDLDMNTRILSLAGWSEYALGIPREEWESMTPEERMNIKEWEKNALNKLDPVQRGIYLNWKKETQKKLKEKNK